MVDDLSGPPDARDTLELLLGEAVPPPASPDLRIGTVVADRYEIRGVIGAGGMGTVYLARDRSLDRDVALKLHRLMAKGERLRREAVAMAKLAHPNVVTVFEVGALGEQTFVAMEYVPGETLRTWARDRSWRAILDAVLAAGEGLAAVHDAGLVHRDVKPDNIFVGKDGRVRIGDFGLARMPGESGAPLPGDTAGLHTRTGTVVGTPAYMAPEQIDGGVIDARTDQFAFCVSAWELLLGTRPYRGDTVEQLRKAMERGELDLAKSSAPLRIRRVLLRGMRMDPVARFPSISALLRVLRAAERGRRVTAAVGVAVLVVGGVITWAVWPAKDPAAACTSAGAEIDELLPIRVVHEVASGLRSAPNLDVAQPLERAADELRGSYRALAQQACVAGIRGTWSHELLDASRECLAYGASTARELITAAPPTSLPPADVAQIQLGLPDLAPCGDPRLLAGWRPLADNLGQLRDIVVLRARLDAALTLISLGRLTEVRTLRDSVAASSLAKAPAVADRLDLVRAMVKIAEHDYRGGEQQLADVYFAARARDDSELALRTVAALIEHATDVRRDPEIAARWSRDGIAEADRTASRLPIQAAEVLAAAASAAAAADDAKTAVELIGRAETLMKPFRRSRVRNFILSVRADIYSATGDVTQALAANDELLASERAALGPHHPALALPLAQRAVILMDATRLAEAAVVAAEAKSLLGDDVPSPTLAAIETDLGATLLGINDPAGVELLERARVGWVAVYGEDHPDVALIDTNLALAAIDRGDTAKALAMLEHAVSVQERALGPDSTELATALYNFAVAQRDANDLVKARATAQRCVDIFAKRQHGSVRHIASLGLVADIANKAHDPAAALVATDQIFQLGHPEESPMGQAWAQLETARALIALRRDPERARTLLRDARVTYSGDKLVDRVAEIDRMLAQLR